MEVFSERTVDLTKTDRQTMDLKRIADRVRKLAIRDFQDKIAVIVLADADGVEIIIGESMGEGEIEEIDEGDVDGFPVEK